MGRGRGKRDKSKNVNEVESARLVKHSYQLRMPTHSPKATSIALNSVPARHNSDSADGIVTKLLVTCLIKPPRLNRVIF